jgi:hypothetical protein
LSFSRNLASGLNPVDSHAPKSSAERETTIYESSVSAMMAHM